MMKTGKTMMMGVVTAVVVTVAVVCTGGATVLHAAEVPVVEGFEVHEWGTFTMVPNLRGQPMPWYVRSGPVELPAFVHDASGGSFRMPGKMSYSAVRMETPVLYFYTDHEMEVNVDVDFPGGQITEWYPHAGYVRHTDPDGRTSQGPFRWARLKLKPNADWQGPAATNDNHYFEARGVGSVPVQVSKKDGSKEQEEFLFYRGMRYGAFRSLHIAATDDGVSLAADGKHAPASVIVFENRNGAMRWKQIAVGTGFTHLKPADWDVADRIPFLG